MTKVKKTIYILLSIFLGIALVFYLFIGFFLKRPGVNGFMIMHGMTEIVLTNKDYVKVGDDRYLYRDGSLRHIIENEYDTYSFLDNIAPPYNELDYYYTDKYGESILFKGCRVYKDGKKLMPITMGIFETSVNTAYFVPDEK